MQKEMNAEPSFPFQGELQELYASACVCAKQEVEVAVACFVYRMRHQGGKESRLRVSNDVLRALKAAGCISCKKISACSLGMYWQAQRQAADAYFGEWVAGSLSTPLGEATESWWKLWRLACKQRTLGGCNKKGSE